MSNRKKKFKMEKALTEKEKQRRLKLREKRAEKKLLDKKKHRKKVLQYICVVIFLIALFVLFAIFRPHWIVYLTLALLFIASFLSDNSGIRSAIMKFYPDKLPFSESLKRPNKNGDKIIEFTKTITYFSLLMFVVGVLSQLWCILCISAYFIASISIIFNTENSIQSKDKRGLTSEGDIITFVSAVLAITYMGNTDWNNTLIVFIIAFSFVFSILYICVSINCRKPISDYIFFALISALFAFGSFCTINREFDFSEPVIYSTQIESMSTSTGRHGTSYFLYVEQWHDNNDDNVTVEISHDDYKSLNESDSIKIAEYNGLLGMKYYYYDGKSNC